MNEYVFSMYRADKFYGPGRQVLANISLSFFHGAKIGVIGLNGSGKSTLLRIIAGLDESFRRRGALPRAQRRHAASRSRGSTERKTSGRVEEGVPSRRDLLDRFEAINDQLRRSDADFDALISRAGRAAGANRPRSAWDLDAGRARAMDALRCRRAMRASRCSPAASGGVSRCAGCC